jgi:carboxymethylenebutenolidase
LRVILELVPSRTLEKNGMTGRMIEIASPADGFVFGAYHVPAHGHRRGGLVLVQEIFGINDNIKKTCEDFANEGYEVIAPSLYDRIEKGFVTDYGDTGMARARQASADTDMTTAIADSRACVELLAERGKVFFTGYCYGGSITYVAACRIPGIAAGSSYYGRLIPDYLGETPKCPLILHFGDTDPSIPLDAVRKIQAARPEMRIYLYNAGHGFCSDRATHFNAKACALARARTLDHFQRHGAN